MKNSCRVAKSNNKSFPKFMMAAAVHKAYIFTLRVLILSGTYFHESQDYWPFCEIKYPQNILKLLIRKNKLLGNQATVYKNINPLLN